MLRFCLPEVNFFHTCSNCTKNPIPKQVYVCLVCPKPYLLCTSCLTKSQKKNKGKKLKSIEKNPEKNDLNQEELQLPQQQQQQHHRRHPMQLLLSKQQWKDYFLNDPLSESIFSLITSNNYSKRFFLGQPQSLTCPLCSERGLSLNNYFKHLSHHYKSLSSSSSALTNSFSSSSNHHSQFICPACFVKYETDVSLSKHKCPMELINTLYDYQIHLESISEPWIMMKKLNNKFVNNSDEATTTTTINNLSIVPFTGVDVAMNFNEDKNTKESNSSLQIQLINKISTNNENQINKLSIERKTLRERVQQRRLLLNRSPNELSPTNSLKSNNKQPTKGNNFVNNKNMNETTSSKHKNTTTGKTQTDIYANETIEKTKLSELILETVNKLYSNFTYTPLIYQLVLFLDDVAASTEFIKEFSAENNHTNLNNLRRLSLGMDKHMEDICRLPYKQHKNTLF